MRVAVMAAGAVGGYFGARIAAASHDVAFIARGAYRDAIRRDGLKIESALGDELGHLPGHIISNGRLDASCWPLADAPVVECRGSFRG